MFVQNERMCLNINQELPRQDSTSLIGLRLGGNRTSNTGMMTPLKFAITSFSQVNVIHCHLMDITGLFWHMELNCISILIPISCYNICTQKLIKTSENHFFHGDF